MARAPSRRQRTGNRRRLPKRKMNRNRRNLALSHKQVGFEQVLHKQSIYQGGSAVIYFLILSDKVYEERAGGVSGALYGVSNYKLYVSDTDGLSATNWIAFPTTVQTRANTNSFYYKVRQKNISGTTDWYYPSRAELETIVQNLYPTTTSATLFKTGGSQALGTSNPTGYWTSSIRPIYNYPSGFSWYLWASETKYGGGMYSPPYGSNNQEYLFYFRPIRRVRK